MLCQTVVTITAALAVMHVSGVAAAMPDITVVVPAEFHAQQAQQAQQAQPVPQEPRVPLAHLNQVIFYLM